MANSIFYNADYVVVEYIDLIKSPYIILLNQLRHNERIKEILKTEEVEFLSPEGLYEWYINRKHQNFFKDLNRYPHQITDENMDALLEDQIGLTEQFYTKAGLLPLGGALKIMKAQKLANDIIIYFPHHNSFAKNDLESTLHEKFIFMDNFDDVVDLAKYNSTYFLSNVELIHKIKEKGYLKFSSLTFPIEYRYNKKNMRDFKVDFEELFKEDPFKYSFTRACTEINGKG